MYGKSPSFCDFLLFMDSLTHTGKKFSFSLSILLKEIKTPMTLMKDPANYIIIIPKQEILHFLIHEGEIFGFLPFNLIGMVTQGEMWSIANAPNSPQPFP